jgi:hypothetical protein
LPADAARRIALAAQGFVPRPARSPGPARLLKAVRALGPLQIDSVNVLIRAHYMPLFSRLGAYDRDVIDRFAYRERRLFEYWAHRASLVPIELYPLFGPFMRAVASGDGVFRRFAAWAKDKRRFIDEVHREVADRGPLAAGELSRPGKRSGPWWGWADGKTALEWLFFTGRVTVAARRNFERLYDLTERVIPASLLSAPEADAAAAHRALLRLSARALGVATAADLADYYQMRPGEARLRIAELTEEGAIVPVWVEGWKQPAYLSADAPSRSAPSTALVSPFDSLVWTRPRVERLFGFRYRIEIYVPAPKREYGYYVLPFLHEGRLAGRVDLKADRALGNLIVQGAFAENGADRRAVAAALGEELHAMAGWLGLPGVEVRPRGELAPLLR